LDFQGSEDDVAALGFGIAGALDLTIAGSLAVAAERAGFDTFWANDTPSGDGLRMLGDAASRTSSIGLGVGVIPVDRQSAESITAKARDYGLPADRLMLGIGSGGLRKGTVEAVETAIDELRTLGNFRILVGALGPRMLDLAGRKADGVLLNWLTPKAAEASATSVRDVAANVGRKPPVIAAYVRVGLENATSRVKVEGDRYASIPAYGAHFRRMGVSPFETTAHGNQEAIRRTLAEFSEVVDEVVVRAIVADETEEAYLALLDACRSR
jgi:alkanesulfonate monooxygenase SsuD/methylene tetrahydromethanopterin reductase-like flavin-dependent oxidoreductase (luciferase family)